MKLILNYQLEPLVQFRSKFEPGFSINEFVAKHHRDKLSSVTNGMDDEHFSLEEDFHGEVDLRIFYLRRNIGNTGKFLLEAKSENYILTGVKGLARLLLDHRSELPDDSWILSPNKTLTERSNFYNSAIPYMTATRNYVNLHHSSHSVDNMNAGMYVLLGKKV